MSAVSFVARVEKKYRIYIPREVREAADIREGDYVQVFVRKVRESERLTRHP